MSRGYHLWHNQPLDRVTLPRLANPPSCNESPRQWNQEPVTLIYQWKNNGGGGGGGGKRMIQRLNEETGRQENAVLSTGR